MRWRPLVLTGLMTGALVGCSSPEATRVRAGGPGADIRNRSRVVQMHEGSSPYHRTPRLIGDVGLKDLGPARQAAAAGQKS